MSSGQRPGLDHRTEGLVGEWLRDGPDELPQHVLQDVIQNTATTPQTRRRFLGRWLDRDEGSGRRAARRDHPPDQNRRTKLMLNAASVIALLAVAALAVNVVDTEPDPVLPGASSRTLLVGPSGSEEYTTIAEAVEAAADGDTIELLPGEYVEAVVIDKDITLIGDPDDPSSARFMAPPAGPTTDIPEIWVDARYALALKGAKVDLQGFTFAGEDARLLIDGGDVSVEHMGFDEAGTEYVGSLVLGALVTSGDATVSIAHSDFDGGGGVMARASGPIALTGNTLTNGPGIAGQFSPGSTIEGNVIVGPGTAGIGILDKSDVLVARNAISDRYNAIYTYPDAGEVFAGAIRDNVINGASNGISVYTRESAEITGNAIGDGRVGIQLHDGDAYIADNEVSGQKTAIGIFGGAPTLEGNIVTGNDAGLSVAGGATPILVDNVFCGNETDVASIGELDLSGNVPCDEAGME